MVKNRISYDSYAEVYRTEDREAELLENNVYIWGNKSNIKIKLFVQEEEGEREREGNCWVGWKSEQHCN